MSAQALIRRASEVDVFAEIEPMSESSSRLKKRGMSLVISAMGSTMHRRYTRPM